MPHIKGNMDAFTALSIGQEAKRQILERNTARIRCCARSAPLRYFALNDGGRFSRYAASPSLASSL